MPPRSKPYDLALACYKSDIACRQAEEGVEWDLA
jgi:hypothetical protein